MSEFVYTPCTKYELVYTFFVCIMIKDTLTIKPNGAYYSSDLLITPDKIF